MRYLCLIALVAAMAVPADRVRADDDPIVAAVKKHVKHHDKPFTMVIGLKVKDGTGEKFETAFAKALKATRKEKGCLSYDLNRGADNAYQVYERWKSVADLEAHLKTDHIKALREVLHEVLDGMPALHVYIPASE